MAKNVTSPSDMEKELLNKLLQEKNVFSLVKVVIHLMRKAYSSGYNKGRTFTARNFFSLIPCSDR